MLVGQKSTLRRVERGDLPRIAEWRNRPDIWRHFFNAFPISLSGQERWFDGLLGSNDRILFMIVDKETQQPVGTVGLDRIDWQSRNAEYGNMLIGSPEHAGRGYARDATDTVLRYAFHELGMERTYLYVAARNLRAIQLYETCGFQREGTLRHALFTRGAFEDKILMAILRQEFCQNVVTEDC